MADSLENSESPVPPLKWPPIEEKPSIAPRRSWSWVWCVAANMASLVAVVIGTGMTPVNSSAVPFFRNDLAVLFQVHFTAIGFSILTFCPLWLVSGVPNSRFKWLLGVIASAAALAATMVAMHMVTESGAPIWVMVHIFVSGLIAIFPLRMMGLQFTLGTPIPPGARWQFSIRSMIGITIVVSIYTAISMNFVQQGILFKTCNALYPENPPPDGVIYVVILGASVSCAMILALFSRSITGVVVALAAAIVLIATGLCMEILTLAIQPVPLVVVGMGAILLAPSLIALPWSLAGYRGFLGKPLFEK